MNSKYRYLLKNTGILTICNFSSKVLVFFLIPLYTSVLSTAEYGTYEIILSTIQFFMPILTINISDGVLRFLMDKNQNAGSIKGIGLTFSIVAIVSFGVILLFNNIFGVWLDFKKYSLEAFIYYIVFALNQLVINTAKGQEHVFEMGVAGIINTVVSLFLNILFLAVLNCGLKGFFYAYIIGYAVSTLYLIFAISYFKDISFKFTRNQLYDIIKYSFPLIFVSLSWLINNISDRYIITWLCGTEENGIYSVAYKIPNIITMIQNMFIQAWTISAIKEYNSDDKVIFYRDIFIQLNCVICITCSGLILLTKNLSEILFSNDFFAAWKYVPFLLVSVVFGASSGFVGPILSAEKKSKIMAISTFIGAFSNIVLNILLIPYYGAQGAAIATALSSLFIYILREYAVKGVMINKKYALIISSWIILIVQAVLLINNCSIIFQILCLIVVLFLYKKPIIHIFMCIKDIIWRKKCKY